MPELFKSYADAYGVHPDIDTWIAESVYHEYPEDGDEILAGSVCHTTDLPWEDAEVFRHMALIINGRPTIVGIAQELSVPELAYAVYRLKVCHPESQFNDAVAAYIASIGVAEGYTILPKILGFAQHLIPITQLTDIQREVLQAKLNAIDEVLYNG